MKMCAAFISASIFASDDCASRRGGRYILTAPKNSHLSNALAVDKAGITGPN